MLKKCCYNAVPGINEQIFTIKSLVLSCVYCRFALAAGRYWLYYIILYHYVYYILSFGELRSHGNKLGYSYHYHHCNYWKDFTHELITLNISHRTYKMKLQRPRYHPECIKVCHLSVSPLLMGARTYPTSWSVTAEADGTSIATVRSSSGVPLPYVTPSCTVISPACPQLFGGGICRTPKVMATRPQYIRAISHH